MEAEITALRSEVAQLRALLEKADALAEAGQEALDAFDRAGIYRTPGTVVAILRAALAAYQESRPK